MTHQVKREHLRALLRPILESGDGENLMEQFDDHIRASATESSGWDFRELIFQIIVDFLGSDEHQAVRTAARIIRRNKRVYGSSSELDAIVEALSTITDRRTITTASEAALTLGFLLSTRPRDRDLPSWDGSNPLSQQGMKDLDQYELVPETPDGPGFIDNVDDTLVDDAIDTLVDNVDRKDYKRSTNWDVGEACTLAIGFIGYQSPKRVETAVPVLIDAVEQDDTDVKSIIYALTSIGYSRPDLLGGNVINWIESLAHNSSGNVPWSIKVQAQVGTQKIGHAPTWVGKIGTYPGPALDAIFEKLFRFMLGRYPSYNDEVSNAVLDIVQARPNDAITILADELQRVTNGNYRTLNFSSNLMGILKEVSEIRSSEMQPIAAQARDIYSIQGMEHYWYDLASDLLQNVYNSNPNYIPSGLDTTLRDFLKNEQRHSVTRSTNQLLDTIT